MTVSDTKTDKVKAFKPLKKNTLVEFRLGRSAEATSGKIIRFIPKAGEGKGSTPFYEVKRLGDGKVVKIRPGALTVAAV